MEDISSKTCVKFIRNDVDDGYDFLDILNSKGLFFAENDFSSVISLKNLFYWDVLRMSDEYQGQEEIQYI